MKYEDNLKDIQTDIISKLKKFMQQNIKRLKILYDKELVSQEVF